MEESLGVSLDDEIDTDEVRDSFDENAPNEISSSSFAEI